MHFRFGSDRLGLAGVVVVVGAVVVVECVTRCINHTHLNNSLAVCGNRLTTIPHNWLESPPFLSLLLLLSAVL